MLKARVHNSKSATSIWFLHPHPDRMTEKISSEYAYQVLNMKVNLGASVHIGYVNTVAKKKTPFYCCVFTAYNIHCCCQRRPIQMAGLETTWELHTLTVINSC